MFEQCREISLNKMKVRKHQFKNFPFLLTMQLFIILSRDCKFKNVEAAVYRNECIHNPLISGLISTPLNNIYLKTHQPNCR